MTRKRTKAKTMKILDEATMTYKIVHLYNVVFSPTNPERFPLLNVQIYSPDDASVLANANRLYAGKGAFGIALKFEKVQ